MTPRRALPALSALLLLPLAAACSGSGTAAPASSVAVSSPPPASAPARASASPSASTTATPAAAPDSPVLWQGPDQVLAAARAGLVSAGSVHLSGSGTEKGTTFVVDVRVTRTGGRGSVAADGQKVDLVALGKVVYFRADAAVYRKQGGSEAAKLLAGRWLKGSSSTEDFRDLGAFSSLRGVSEDVLDPSGRLRLTRPTTRQGQRVVGLTENGGGGTLYVTASEPVRPVELVPGSSGRGEGLRFTEYGVPVVLKAPADALDLAKLARAGH